jgi:hypothetical protein
MKWWQRLSQSRLPDFIVGEEPKPYLRRWWVMPRNALFNIYLHQFLRSDDDRALHDHMYFNVSFILEGMYIEHTIAQGGVNYQKSYYAGNLRFRLPWTAHRIEIDSPCWSLFITGPRIRQWGFHCPKGWRHWKEFVSDRNYGKIRKGCED